MCGLICESILMYIYVYIVNISLTDYEEPDVTSNYVPAAWSIDIYIYTDYEEPDVTSNYVPAPWSSKQGIRPETKAVGSNPPGQTALQNWHMSWLPVWHSIYYKG